MNRAARLVFTLGLTANLSFAQTPSAPQPSSFPPITAKDVRILPMSGKADFMVLKGERDFPDELRAVVTTNRVHISGRKRVDEHKVRGTIIENSGKMALLPPGERFGSLTAKMPSVERSTIYYVVLEFADGSFKHTHIKLDKDKPYLWSLTRKGSEYALSVSLAGSGIAQVTTAASNLKSFGFGSTVRYKGVESDLTFTVGDGK